MKIGYLGMGAWGYCLASLLASLGHQLICWTTKPELAKHLTEKKEHPLLPGHRSVGEMHFTTEINEALDQVEFLIESVTSAGIRPVLEMVKKQGFNEAPLVITSKGIEQGTGKILPEVALEIFGDHYRSKIGCLSGPSFAKEVIKGLPTSVVGTGYSSEIMMNVCELFTTPYFRVYPNIDMKGVAFGGALKNIIGLACGIAEGLALGCSAKAALMTRGLHEIKKLAVAADCKAETINGLSGMGDLCVTCSSPISRNFRCGMLLAQGFTLHKAQEHIGMVVEGAYTCTSALELAKKYQIELPIASTVYDILNNEIHPVEAVKALMQRTVKEEHL